MIVETDSMKPLFIPSLGIFVLAKTGDRQKNTDAPNTAAMWNWGKLTVIADHNYQGFSRLNRAVIGKTRAYLGPKAYICDVSEIGHVRLSEKGNRLYRASWFPVWEAWSDGLCLYTCITQTASDVIDVRLTHWRDIT